jgi:hypothetical protein
MTMLPGDYPDNLRVAQQQGAPLYNPGALAVGGGAVTSPVFYVGPWEALWIKATSWGGAGHWSGMTVTWYADPAATIALGSKGFSVENGGTYEEIMLNLGAWVQFHSQSFAGGAASTLTPIVVPLSSFNNARDAQDQLEYVYAASAIGISGTLSVPLPIWTPGPAILSVFGTAAYELVLQDLLEPGVIVGQPFGSNVPAAPWSINQLIFLGRYQPTLQFTNGAAAQTVTYSVIGQQ